MSWSSNNKKKESEKGLILFDDCLKHIQFEFEEILSLILNTKGKMKKREIETTSCLSSEEKMEGLRASALSNMQVTHF